MVLCSPTDNAAERLPASSLPFFEKLLTGSDSSPQRGKSEKVLTRWLHGAATATAVPPRLASAALKSTGEKSTPSRADLHTIAPQVLEHWALGKLSPLFSAESLSLNDVGCARVRDIARPSERGGGRVDVDQLDRNGDGRPGKPGQPWDLIPKSLGPS